MPNCVISWLNAAIPPRSSVGECSEMYIGATNDAVPTPSPTTKRAASSHPRSGPRYDPRAPTVNTTPATSSVDFRLMTSASRPDMPAPTTAPISSEPTTQDSPRALRRRASLAYGRAPLTMPVS